MVNAQIRSAPEENRGGFSALLAGAGRIGVLAPGKLVLLVPGRPPRELTFQVVTGERPRCAA